MKKSTFNITQMVCPSEEQMIRMKLESLEGIKQLNFDIPNRTLAVIHSIESSEILDSLEDLKLGTTLTSEGENVNYEVVNNSDHNERKMLWVVLIINFAFFIIELLYGWLSNSMGLIADSLDMLADSLVYAMSLMAVGRTLIRKKKVAKWSGYFQILLAIIGLAELFRRVFVSSVTPEFKEMIGISILALIANSVCLYLIQKSKSKEAHMQASAIFTSNDIIINTGVIVAGVLVYFTQSKYPDLVIGLIIFAIVVKGAFRILKLSK
ncbi:cation diffusion facilitator family transporter [Acidiluteibacter ferrifornacis]|uniref:Cation transporter n=1 Tax=Acidiluteibacter ferrifornacis TaxID=2692424 RepID=A0A6N9NGE8_9FLAO|nr:cation diffusion facilitator family transporter [Acidiluteibacter ferrifornacis]NBG65716.1 cation transporter [Acidiluteibacter ferrifornacis]